MQARDVAMRMVVIGSALTAAAGLSAPPADASTTASTTARKAQHEVPGATKAAAKSSVHLGGGDKSGGLVASRAGMAAAHLGNAVYFHTASRAGWSKSGKMRFATRAGGESDESYGGSLQCVPFARAASGIELKGNAAEWWYAASGVYDRGARPELGSVLNFRPTSRMRLGHVAVVTGVVNDREIEIDHANWAGAGAYKGGVARGVHVTDVSAANDWSEVQVALPDGRWGSTYPTYGFIYDRPDSGAFAGSMVAKNQAVRDAADGAEADDTEVAEAPSHPARLVHTVAARTTSVHTASAQTAASHHASRSLHVLVRHVSYTSSN